MKEWQVINLNRVQFSKKEMTVSSSSSCVTNDMSAIAHCFNTSFVFASITCGGVTSQQAIMVSHANPKTGRHWIGLEHNNRLARNTECESDPIPTSRKEGGFTENGWVQPKREYI